jgi:flagellar hook-associated protein 1 FlgK
MSINGTFFGLNIGASALLSSSDEQDVIGNNIANANTTGYSVETANEVQAPETSSYGPTGMTTVGTFGSGVSVSTITRARDVFLDQALRTATSEQGSQSELTNNMTSVQSVINEPSTSGVSAALTTFFNSFSNLQSDPEDSGVRTSVIGAAQALTQVLNSTQTSLDTQATEIQTETSANLTSVNSIGADIANLNTQIAVVQAQGQQPNTLMDQRDNDLDNLSKLVNISYNTGKDGAVNVNIGGTSLVSGSAANTVTLAGLQANNDITQGSLAGDVQSATDLNGFQTNLDTMTTTLMSQVNTIHEAGAGLDGTTGLPFFTGSSARDIAVNSTIVSDPSKLAAAAAPATAGTAPAAGDGTTAEALYNLQNTMMTSGPLAGQTIQQYYAANVTQMGQQIDASTQSGSVATASVTQLTTQRDSVSGVNVDQEMTSMIQYQQAYQAAAKIISTNADMLTSLINMVGS